MDRENRLRANLSLFEQGMMYKAAIDKRDFFSRVNALSKAVGVSQPTVSTALLAASLPIEVVKSFRSPVEIQVRFCSPPRKIFERKLGRCD